MLTGGALPRCDPRLRDGGAGPAAVPGDGGGGQQVPRGGRRAPLYAVRPGSAAVSGLGETSRLVRPGSDTVSGLGETSRLVRPG